MFRAAAASPFDDVVAKATDENLTSEDWGAIMEVCDKVASDNNGAKEAVQSMIKRLAHRNANVQLYTLELAHALSQNCDKNMHRELSSRAFTDALLRLANDRNTHSQVKPKIIERMKEWTEMFSSDPSLGIMNDAYLTIKKSNPTLHPPSAPQKRGLTDVDRQKEEDELQIALKLSLEEEERKKAAATAAASSSSQAGPSTQPETAAPPPVPAGTTAATVSRVRALYDFVPSEPGELEFKKGDVIAVLESVYKDWWRGSLRGKTGIFPLNYVEKLTDPTPDELQREAQMEAEVFAEIKNVEKLLTLLSASNTGPREEDNEEISKLYHQTLAIRPKLIKLIEKYSQKKDDFTQLNEKFIKARRDYETLLESSMAHPPQPSYPQYPMRPAPQGQGYGGYPPQGGRPDQVPYQTSSPPPNFPSGTQAPFYVAGTEVPATQPYPPRDQTPANGRQPAPINTTTPSQNYNPYNQPLPQDSNPYNQPPPQDSNPYSQPPPQDNNPYSQPSHGHQRPGSTYGAQELATSVYDSPIAPNPAQAAPFSSTAYSPDETPNNANPYATQGQQSQSQYQSYRPGEQAPPIPTGQPPQPPTSVMTPPPLQPGGPAYDARHNLPSQSNPGGEQQYKPYVPPGDAPSAPAPSDYYRQNGVY